MLLPAAVLFIVCLPNVVREDRDDAAGRERWLE